MGEKTHYPNMTDTQKALADKVMATLGPSARRYSNVSVNHFFEGICEEGQEPTRSMACVLMSFVCSAVHDGKLVLIQRDRTEHKAE